MGGETSPVGKTTDTVAKSAGPSGPVGGSASGWDAARGSSYAAGKAGLKPAPPAASNVENTPGLSHLSTPASATDVAVSRPDEDIAKNTPDPTTRLPFTTTGWDAPTILDKLGQYDRVGKTDSDATRCVQAVGLASHILSGPEAVNQWMASLGASGMLAAARITPRVKAALGVIDRVHGAIERRTATYGDLSWAQEATHDLSYADKDGTPVKEVGAQVVPVFDMNTLKPSNVWCSTTDQLLAQAGKLEEKQQLLVTTMTVSFNTMYDKLNPDEVQDTMNVEVVSPDGKSKMRRISRMDTTKKPAPEKVDNVRDSVSGHQMLIYKSGGKLWVYEPEITASGKHLSEVAKDGSSLASLVKDQPKFGMFGYVQVMGTITPSSLYEPSPWGAAS